MGVFQYFISKTGSWLDFAGSLFANPCSVRRRLVNSNFPNGIIYIADIPSLFNLFLLSFIYLFLNRSTQAKMSRPLELYHGYNERFLEWYHLWSRL